MKSNTGMNSAARKFAHYFSILFFLCLPTLVSTAQKQQVYYASIRSGMSIRSKPSATAEVIGKIPYGQQVQLLPDTGQLKPITTEGFEGFWYKVNYSGKTGFVVSNYLLPTPPPAKNVKKFEDYFKQVTKPLSAPVIIGDDHFTGIEDNRTKLTKYFYRNGMERHETSGYEYGSSCIILPGYSIQSAYLLVRLIGEYENLIGPNDSFPVKNDSLKNNEREKSIKVSRFEPYNPGTLGPIEKISITEASGAFTELNIFMIDGQAVVLWSAGV